MEHVTPGGRQLSVLRAITRAPEWRGRRVGQPVRNADARGVWIDSPKASAGGVIFFVHGGGLVLGSSQLYAEFGERLGDSSGLAVFLVDYGLAPEHRYPEAEDAVLSAYRWLVAQGHDPSSVVVVGDSAGGTLLLHLLGDLKRLALPQPAGVILLSPGVDLTFDLAEARDRMRRDPVIRPSFGRACVRAYVGEAVPEGLDVLGSDLRGWPPMLIVAGETECLVADAEALRDALEAVGVPCELEVWPGQVHVFAFFGFLPEGRAAMERIGRFAADACAGVRGAEAV
ncbi:MAG TPA: alpha/beta hydrolase [Nocardioidaceae bacterium]|nr:alpha/beta hydrolase [Nocardioidaceae bacterium]